MTSQNTEDSAVTVRPPRPQTSFGGDVLKLVSGTTIAQLLSILASPILTRLYAPEAFGLLAIFTSITSIIGVIACLRYELAIMLPESDEEAANLLGVSLLFTVLISLLAVPVVWWGGDLIVGWLNSPGLGPYLWLVPPMVFITGVFLALNYWNSRTKQFGRLSIARVIQSVATTSTQLGLGLGGMVTGGVMIGASVGGRYLATAVLGGQIWRNDRKLFMSALSRRTISTSIDRYKKFPIYSTWSALLNTISIQLPALLLSAFFSPVIVGFYALGYRLLNIPMSLIGSSIAQVFYQRASVAVAEQQLASVIRSTSKRLISLGIFPFVLLSVMAPELFVILFGEEWLDAGIYAQILAPWLFFVFLGSPISTLNSVLELQEIGLVFNIVLVLSRAASLMIGGLFDSILLALSLFSISGTILWIWLCFFLFSKADLTAVAMGKMIGYHLIVAGIFVAPLVFSKWVLHSGPFALVLTGLILLPAYYSYIIIKDNELRSVAVEVFLRRR